MFHSNFPGFSIRWFIVVALLYPSVHFSQNPNKHNVDSVKSVLKTQEGKERVHSLNELAWYYKNIDVDSALYFSFEALKIAKIISNDTARATALNSLANTYDALGKFDSAEYFHKKVIDLRSISKDSLGLASAYNNLGIVYDKMGRFEPSLNQYFIALELYEKHTSNLYDVAMVLGNIGIVYKKQKSYAKVLEYYQRALEIYVQVKSEFGQTVTKGNIGSLLINMGQYEASIDYSESALAGYLAQGYVRYEPYMQQNIAVAYDSLHQYLLSEKYYNLSVTGHTAHQNLYELSATLNSLTNSYLKQRKYTKALKVAKQALKQSQVVKSKDAEVRARKYLSEAYGGLKNYENAYFNLGLYEKGNDSLFNIERTKAIEELQTRYETEKKEEEIKVQGLELISQKAINSKNTILIFALSFGIVMIVLIGLLLKNRLQKKQQLLLQQKSLEYKELQLSAVIDSQEKERKRFATDLHDGFGQLISILKLNVESIEQQNDNEKRHSLFEKSTTILNDMYGELRNICFNLMPQSLVKFGLIPSLKEFADKINDSGKLVVEVLTFDMDDRLPNLQEISLYRITQEWVNNILKYGDAENITIQITKDNFEITLTIEDNGTGFELEKLIESKGNGWKNMRSRANLIHADIEVDTTPHVKGNMLVVNLPIETEKNTESKVL